MAETVIPEATTAVAFKEECLNLQALFCLLLCDTTAKKPKIFRLPRHGGTYHCDHPAYSVGTLYFFNGIGLVVIQQRYDKNTERTWWGEIDEWLVEAIYSSPGFDSFFNKNAKEKRGDIFPTFTIRQVMWALRMKPLKKEPLETVFDRKPI